MWGFQRAQSSRSRFLVILSERVSIILVPAVEHYFPLSDVDDHLKIDSWVRNILTSYFFTSGSASLFFKSTRTFPEDLLSRMNWRPSFTFCRPTIIEQDGLMRPSSKNCNTSSPAWLQRGAQGFKMATEIPSTKWPPKFLPRNGVTYSEWNSLRKQQIATSLGKMCIEFFLCTVNYFIVYLKLLICYFLLH